MALILSDVIGDPLDLIASGPTVWSDSRPEDVWVILDRYKLSDSLPSSVKEVLSKARPHGLQAQEQPQEVKDNVLNVVIGSNTIALECASRKAIELGLSFYLQEYVVTFAPLHDYTGCSQVLHAPQERNLLQSLLQRSFS